VRECPPEPETSERFKPYEKPSLVVVERNLISAVVQGPQRGGDFPGLQLCTRRPAVVTGAQRLKSIPQPLLNIVYGASALDEPDHVARDFDLVVVEDHDRESDTRGCQSARGPADMGERSEMSSGCLSSGVARCSGVPHHVDVRAIMVGVRAQCLLVAEADALVELYRRLELRVRLEKQGRTAHLLEGLECSSHQQPTDAQAANRWFYGHLRELDSSVLEPHQGNRTDRAFTLVDCEQHLATACEDVTFGVIEQFSIGGLDREPTLDPLDVQPCEVAPPAWLELDHPYIPERRSRRVFARWFGHGTGSYTASLSFLPSPPTKRRPIRLRECAGMSPERRPWRGG